MQRLTPEVESSYVRELSNLWIKAAAELGIEVVAPFELEVGDKHFVYPVLVRHFGGPNGALLIILGAADEEQLLEAARSRGYYCSLGNAGTQIPYNAESFKDILNDWGWHGPPGCHPKWFTGKPWTD